MARRFVPGRSRDGVDPACRLDDRLLGRTGAVGRVGQYRADAPLCHRVRSTGWRHGGRGRLHGRSGHRTRRLRTVGHASPSWPTAHRIGHGIGVHIFQSLVLTTVAVARCAELSPLGRPTRWSGASGGLARDTASQAHSGPDRSAMVVAGSPSSADGVGGDAAKCGSTAFGGHAWGMNRPVPSVTSGGEQAGREQARERRRAPIPAFGSVSMMPRSSTPGAVDTPRLPEEVSPPPAPGDAGGGRSAGRGGEKGTFHPIYPPKARFTSRDDVGHPGTRSPACAWHTDRRAAGGTEPASEGVRPAATTPDPTRSGMFPT